MKHEDLGSFSPAHRDRIFCPSCGTWQEACNGDECDSCQKFTCYECGTILYPEPDKRQWLCEGCAEQAQLDFEGEPEEELDPVAPNHMAWVRKQEIKAEAKAMALEEARGK